MDVPGQVVSALSDLFDALMHPSVASLPAGFLVLIGAVFVIAALPDGAREKLRIAGMTTVALIVSLEMSWPVNWAAILR